MYGVSKINIEPSLMMISVQDVEFKGNSLARYLQIFADNGVSLSFKQRNTAGISIFSFAARSFSVILFLLLTIREVQIVILK